MKQVEKIYQKKRKDGRRKRWGTDTTMVEVVFISRTRRHSSGMRNQQSKDTRRGETYGEEEGAGGRERVEEEKKRQ